MRVRMLHPTTLTSVPLVRRWRLCLLQSTIHKARPAFGEAAIALASGLNQQVAAARRAAEVFQSGSLCGESAVDSE